MISFEMNHFEKNLTSHQGVITQDFRCRTTRAFIIALKTDFQLASHQFDSSIPRKLIDKPNITELVVFQPEALQ